MRKKRNKTNATLSTEGYIKKYFGSDISRILVPNNRNFQNCEVPYVPHPEAENVLKEYLRADYYIDKSLVFTGLTGSGKTTIVRHVFEFEDNANSPHFNGNKVIIPVDFNRSQRSAEVAILSSLRVAVQKICNLFKIDYPDQNNEEFYDYVETRRPDFLTINSKHSPSTSHKEKMNVFCEQMPTTYASCQLQYVMDRPICTLELVVLVVDNIEAFLDPNAKNTKARYLSPVIEAFKLAECIEQRSNPTKWWFNMVISCRHHIWRIMKGEFTENTPENPLLQSYITTGTPYDLSNPVKVNDIVKKRDEVLSRRQSDKTKWSTAVNVVNTILQTMENSIGDFVLQLELKDLRKSLSKMQELIFHKGLQKETDEEIAAGAFQIDSIEQFDLTRVNLIRTIGLGNLKYYSDLSSTIPNLLYNEQQEGIELYPLLTLRYFIIRCGNAEPSWDNPVSIPEFYDNMRTIFRFSDQILYRTFGRAVQFLIQHRLLLRSADQPQDEIPGLSIEETKKIEYVYVSGSAVRLWEELERSSALFQLYIDDIWLEETEDYFKDDGNDIEHCVKYLSVLYRTEKKIFNTAKNLSARCAKRYLEYFGETPICLQLLAGLISSLETITSSGDSRLQGRIQMAEKTLCDADALEKEMIEWMGKRFLP